MRDKKAATFLVLLTLLAIAGLWSWQPSRPPQAGGYPYPMTPTPAPTRTPTPTIPWYPWRQVWMPIVEVYR